MRIDHIEDKERLTRKFFIRLSSDSHEHSKNIIISSHKIGDDYMAQLVENVFDDRAWFYYDDDYHRIRLASNPEWVLSNARGKGYKPGETVIFTKFNKHKPEQYVSISGSKIRNRAHKCLTPKDYRKNNFNSLEFWICSHNKKQRWQRLDKMPVRTIYGDFSKDKFALQMTASGRRRVFMSRVNTLGGFMAKIKQGVHNWRSWFIYDKRTKSLRLEKDRSMVLSNQLGKSSRPGYLAVFRKFQGTKDQRIIVNNGRYIKNEAGFCLTPKHLKNDDHVSLMWTKCHRLNQQRFSKEFYSGDKQESYKEKLNKLKEKVKATILGQQPIKPIFKDQPVKTAKATLTTVSAIAPKKKLTRVLPKFFLRLNVPGKHLNLIMSDQASNGEYLAKLKSHVYDWRSWFVFDKRTRSIRLAHKPEFALASGKDSGFKVGSNVVFRSYSNELYRETFIVFHKKQVLNIELQCLTPADFKAEENNNVVWQKCNKDTTQRWQRGEKVKDRVLYGDQSKKNFQISLNMPGNRKVFVSNHRFGSEYILKINKDVNDWRSWFTYDKRTKSIRLVHNRNFAISN